MPMFFTVLLVTESWLHIPGGTWDPDAATTAETKGAIEAYVKDQAMGAAKELPDWSTYSFQYQGRNLQGVDVIYVNGFCIPIPSYADKQMVVVEDGGTCFFSAYYDPIQKRFIGLNFKGHA